jgi:tripartite-type tricarboxylate transporter receptor subunit TctC
MMSHDRLASGVVLALALMTSSPTPAWPDQPVRIVVPFAAGGTTDVMARVLAERL